MERLTAMNKEKTAHFYPQCFERCGGVGSSRKCDNCDLSNRACDKLGEFEDLEEQGKLLKLPCAVGDVVYKRNSLTKEQVPIKVESIFICKSGINISGRTTARGYTVCFNPSDFGVSVFKEAQAE